MIDPRGPRTAAWITSAVLAVVLLLGFTTGAALLLAAQAVVFALGSRGRSPYALLFRRLVRPRLAPPAELEAEAPTRFAQLVGLVFATAGVVGALLGVEALFLGATGAALAAAFLNAAFGLCLGCEMHVLIHRSTNKGVPA